MSELWVAFFVGAFLGGIVGMLILSGCIVAMQPYAKKPQGDDHA